MGRGVPLGFEAGCRIKPFSSRVSGSDAQLQDEVAELGRGQDRVVEQHPTEPVSRLARRDGEQFEHCTRSTKTMARVDGESKPDWI